MTGPACRIDEAEIGETELVQCRCEGTVQNELLDELRRLQQCVTLLRILREILVQVAQETGVPLRVGEVVPQCAGIRVHHPPERQQIARSITGYPMAPYRVVLVVVEARDPGQT